MLNKFSIECERYTSLIHFSIYITKLLQSYLRNRHFQVYYSGAVSSTKPITAGFLKEVFLGPFRIPCTRQILPKRICGRCRHTNVSQKLRPGCSKPTKLD